MYSRLLNHCTSSCAASRVFCGLHNVALQRFFLVKSTLVVRCCLNVPRKFKMRTYFVTYILQCNLYQAYMLIFMPIHLLLLPVHVHYQCKRLHRRWDHLARCWRWNQASFRICVASQQPEDHLVFLFLFPWWLFVIKDNERIYSRCTVSQQPISIAK